MDKILAEYTVKPSALWTLQWPLAFFYHMSNVTGLACYVICKEHNARFRAKDQQRKFLKELANMLCMPSTEARCNNKMVIRNHFLRGAVKIGLGWHVVTSRENAAVARAHHGPTRIVERCCVCRDQKRKQQKIRKSRQSACNKHTVFKTMCIHYENK